MSTIISAECTYCGHKWKPEVYSQAELSSMRCPVCKDTNLVVKALTDTDRDVFGYNYTEARKDAYIKKK